LGGTREQIINALSNAWMDGGTLRAYRHAPNSGPRKSWAAADATARAVRHALMALQGEMGYPSVLSAKQWGFCDALFGSQPIRLERALGCYVMENVLFKVSFPAEFHAQTAVEAAIKLHPQARQRLDEIQRIELTTHQSAIRIIDKRGPLHNPADRDHCLQYMVAAALLFGNLTADHYEDHTASNPQLDALRAKMVVSEDTRYSRDYLDPDKRSIANAVQIFFKNGAATDKVQIEYPLGHRRRRREGIPLLIEKAKNNLLTQLKPGRVDRILALFDEPTRLSAMPANAFMEEFLDRNNHRV
jgi:2-methylcitrate dehydratase